MMLRAQASAAHRPSGYSSARSGGPAATRPASTDTTAPTGSASGSQNQSPVRVTSVDPTTTANTRQTPPFVLGRSVTR